eukprot:TRINITY_DN11197_c0_g1_i1.p1 TRINITY_DN11197_c0_g1~~TRINITY_DN11197_c0_g1_i1.p1  ORF type:complete len:258 (+),score=78.67 TRINITY_DN11197_c0_g1_i1:31-804(+)
MPSLLTSCEELFQTKDLYEVLGIEKSANTAQVKKAYHRASLKVHPDRASEEDRELATKKFQCIGAVYSILSDDSRRGLYDECGEVDDENDPLTQDKDWEEYWRIMFPKITTKDIEEFEKKYKGSDEEKEDVKQAYIDGKGEMEFILDNVMLSTIEDEDRFRAIIDQLIKDKQVKKLKAYSGETEGAKKARKRAADKEAKEAEQATKEMGLDDSEDSLRNMILARQQSRGQQAESFLDGLAAKYGAGSKSQSGKKKKK